VGGYGTVLGQLFRRNFPDYNAGVQINIPLRNRSAQADMILDQLTIAPEAFGPILEAVQEKIREALFQKGKQVLTLVGRS
jgi:hypothetical protein